MRKGFVFVALALLLVSMAQPAPARTRIERWLDVTGDYWNEKQAERWSATANGRLNIIMGVRSKINTALDITYGKNGDDVIANQQLRLSGSYVYDASRTTSFTLRSAMRTLVPDGSLDTQTPGYSTSIDLENNLTMWNYISRRLGLTTGIEYWVRTTGQMAGVSTELEYKQPFGKYLTKAELLQRVKLGWETGGVIGIKSTTRFQYDISRRMSLVLEGIYALNNALGSYDLVYRYQTANVVYHFY